MTGHYDQARPEHRKVLVDRFPDARSVMFEASSHMPYQEEPARFLRALRGFLAARDGDAPPREKRRSF